MAELVGSFYRIEEGRRTPERFCDAPVERGSDEESSSRSPLAASL
jgi:hypothetical protein